MTVNGKILGIIIGGACATIIAGCTAEQGETANEPSDAVAEQTATIEIAPSATDEDSDMSAMAGAPGCVERSMLAQRSLYVHNNCGNRQRVKVIIRTGPDSDCFAIDPNQTKVVNWAWPGTFDRLDSC
ncbi:hypothetical protein LZC95_28190 [Pendulispora brunnea]|uniref:Secreted protein n=1 Tax=Pendulispora brunnea TaxID=2905690 RepID=A0ABZ2JV44_9BACT